MTNFTYQALDLSAHASEGVWWSSLLSKRRSVAPSVPLVFVATLLLLFYFNPFATTPHIDVQTGYADLTVTGDFLKAGSIPQAGELLGNASATSLIFENGNNVSRVTAFLSVMGYLSPVTQNFEYFESAIQLFVGDNLSSNLQPSRIVVNINNIATPGSSCNAFTTFVFPVGPDSWFIGAGSANGTIGLHDISNSSHESGQYNLGMLAECDILLQQTSGFYGPHLFHLTVTLVGLEKVVPIYFNICLNNTGTYRGSR